MWNANLIFRARKNLFSQLSSVLWRAEEELFHTGSSKEMTKFSMEEENVFILRRKTPNENAFSFLYTHTLLLPTENFLPSCAKENNFKGAEEGKLKDIALWRTF